MSYDEALAEKIRGVLAGRDDVTEQRMFGGLAFMIGGRMAVGVVHDDPWCGSVRMATTMRSRARTCAQWTSPGDRCGDSSTSPPAGVVDDLDLTQWVAAEPFAAAQPPKERR